MTLRGLMVTLIALVATVVVVAIVNVLVYLSSWTLLPLFIASFLGVWMVFSRIET